MASFLALIGVGLWRVIASGGHPHAVIAPPHLGHATEAVGLWLLMRAFAAGCTAMTGVEAVSNGVGTFRAPVVAQAHRTLTIICVTLGLLLAGIAAIANAYGLGAMDQTQPSYQSVLLRKRWVHPTSGAKRHGMSSSRRVAMCPAARCSSVWASQAWGSMALSLQVSIRLAMTAQ